MRFSDNLSNIAAALAKVQAEIKNPIKNQINKGVQGSPLYANLEDTLQDYVRPICSKHGISVFQSIKTEETGKVGVCTVLLHESGEFIESDYVFCDGSRCFCSWPFNRRCCAFKTNCFWRYTHYSWFHYFFRFSFSSSIYNLYKNK